MKTAAIIAEYNPFHNGHLYQIQETKRLTGADYIIAVMSGNFVQRGGPALLSKWKRTEMALQNGVDLVLELPAAYAIKSAPGFAYGGVTLLHQLNGIDYLSFGTESGSLKKLYQSLHELHNETPEKKEQLKQEIKSGNSYPKALQKVSASVFSDAPNTILGMEYLDVLEKLQSSITPITIKRAGASYHDTALSDPVYNSASAIRKALLHAEPVTAFMPETVHTVLAKQHAELMHENVFSSLLYYRLICEAVFGFTSYTDCSEALSNKIKKNLPLFTTWKDFSLQLKSKDITYSRINRVLTGILLQQKDAFSSLEPVPYARILGFRSTATALLAELQKTSSIPVITKLADAPRTLSSKAMACLQNDILVSQIYYLALSQKNGSPIKNEYQCSPVIL